VCATDDGQADSASLLSLGVGLGGTGSSLALLSACAAELFGVGEDEVHVLVEGEHLSDHLAAILQRNFHAVIDKILHLSLAICGRHAGRGASEDGLFSRKIGV